MRAAGVPEPLQRRAFSVSALLIAMGDLLATRFAACSVQGEVSGFARAASGHCYFTLKDADGAAASLRCAMFRLATQRLDFAPRDGQLVELRGRIALYEPRGELQFVVESMRAAGAGALYERFLALKARLEAEGLFDPARKRELPSSPGTIGVITSLQGAALHDVLTTLARRAPHVRVVVYPSPVQGADAPDALVRALQTAGRRAEADLLILCRGGGSLEDLWAFNDERVVRAVAACPIALICGVGHETDVTLADFAADLRATTPTGAAELAVPPREALLGALSQTAARLGRAARHRLSVCEQRLDRAWLRLARPEQVLAREGARLARLDTASTQAAQRMLGARRDALARAAAALARSVGAGAMRNRHALERLATRLDAANPQHVLARGYALVHTAQGVLVRTKRQIEPGTRLRLTLAEDEAMLRVAEVDARASAPHPSPLSEPERE